MVVAEARQVLVDGVHYFSGEEVVVSEATAREWGRYGWARPAPAARAKAKVTARTSTEAAPVTADTTVPDTDTTVPTTEATAQTVNTATA